MRFKKIVLIAAFLSVFGPLLAATSRTYEGQCKAWRPDGFLVQNGPCEISVGLLGMTETVSYRLTFQSITVEIRLTGQGCNVEGKKCGAFPDERLKLMRIVSEDRSVFEFTSPPAGSL